MTQLQLVVAARVADQASAGSRQALALVIEEIARQRGDHYLLGTAHGLEFSPTRIISTGWVH